MATTKQATSHKKHLLILFGIFLAGVASFALMTVLNHRIEGSDDTIFQTQILPYANVIDWVQYRYANWSGRIFSEGFIYLLSPAPFYIWQVLTIAMYGLFSAMFFFYYRLFSKSRDRIKDYVMMTIAVAGPFLFHKAVIADGLLWMTGSIVYFWMATLGLLSFYPLVHKIIKGKSTRWYIILFALIAGIIAASSQEQVGAVLVGASFLFLAYEIIRKLRGTRPRFPWFSLVFFVLILGAFLISIKAPGNALRLDLELVRWLPDFYTIPLDERINYSYRWFLDAIVNHTGYLLIISWASMAALFFTKSKRRWFDYVFGITLLIASVFSLARGAEGIAYWFDFYATWRPAITNPIISLNLIPWTIILIMTILAPIVLFKKKPIGLALTVFYLAAFGAAALMLLSPTMYASAWRSLFVPSVLLLLASYILIDKIFDIYKKQRYSLVATLLALSLSNYIHQGTLLLRGA